MVSVMEIMVGIGIAVLLFGVVFLGLSALLSRGARTTRRGARTSGKIGIFLIIVAAVILFLWLLISSSL